MKDGLALCGLPQHIQRRPHHPLRQLRQPVGDVVHGMSRPRHHGEVRVVDAQLASHQVVDEAVQRSLHGVGAGKVGGPENLTRARVEAVADDVGLEPVELRRRRRHVGESLPRVAVGLRGGAAEIVGVGRDPQFGLFLTIGAGGVFVELLRQVKEIAPSTVRLLLTGYSDLAAIVGWRRPSSRSRTLNLWCR